MTEHREHIIYEINKILKYKISLINLRKEIKIPKKIHTKKNNSITLDDIYYVDNRPRWIDIDGYTINLVVKSVTIGYRSIYKYEKISTIQHLNHKYYIKNGEECPICYDKILNKKQAVLTECGHSFHYECIYKYYYLNRNKHGYCPICSQEAKALWGFNYNFSLKSLYHYSSNQLDMLENFWYQMNTLIPDSCYISANNKCVHSHDRGMHRNCKKCIEYRS